jgi:hypothetical protein
MTSEHLRRLAKRCHELCAKAVVAEIREQLEIWAVEFEEAAVEEALQADRKRLKAPGNPHRQRRRV